MLCEDWRQDMGWAGSSGRGAADDRQSMQVLAAGVSGLLGQQRELCGMTLGTRQTDPVLCQQLKCVPWLAWADSPVGQPTGGVGA